MFAWSHLKLLRLNFLLTKCFHLLLLCVVTSNKPKVSNFRKCFKRESLCELYVFFLIKKYNYVIIKLEYEFASQSFRICSNIQGNMQNKGMYCIVNTTFKLQAQSLSTKAECIDHGLTIFARRIETYTILIMTFTFTSKFDIGAFYRLALATD